jgi:protein ImuB
MHWIALRPTPDASTAPLPDTYAALAWWALQFTPLVARVDDALVLEVSGSARLFGGLEALCARICKPNNPVALVQYAQGATSLVALGRLWSAVAPDALPTASLAAARAHLPTLARLGVTTWGQLRALPRGGLVRRFGAELVDTLDRAYGLRPEVYPWLTVPEVFDAPLELSAAVDAAPALLFGARRLLAQLLVWLRARQQGVLALELLWELDARRSNAQHVDAHHAGQGQGRLVLRTAQATQDMQHLQRLLGERLTQVTLPAPVLYLRLRTLQTQALVGESHSLLIEDQRVGDSLHQTLERLGARLGAHQVLCAQLAADHRPECMQQWQPWSPDRAMKLPVAIKKGATSPINTWEKITEGSAWESSQDALESAAFYPTWLLEPPRKLELRAQHPYYQGPLTLLAGPQRLESGWLQGPAALRDYFVAQSVQTGLLWIYRERLGTVPPTQWYLHGIFA